MSCLIPREHLTFPLAKPVKKAKAAKPLKVRSAKLRRADQRDGMCEDYLAAIRRLPCCTCGKPGPSDPHHLKRGTGERGLGLRSTDKWAIPQCRECHDEVEAIGSQNEPQFYARQGIRPLVLAATLWAAWTVSGDVAELRRIVAGHAPTHGDENA